MIFTFLSASQPIVKRYELSAEGTLIKHPYPFIYEVTSHDTEIDSLQMLHHYMLDHARQGHCLLKGTLSRPLISESRAGSTDREALTSWICLDLDGIDGYATPQTFLNAIYAGNVDHIVQWSSGMNLDSSVGLRCHIFILLDKPAHPQLLKQWLIHLNLSILPAQMQLTKTGNALRWPLDITTCQNDKLLYIAPPKLGKGIKDPFARQPRITFHKGISRTFTIPTTTIPNAAALTELSDKRINELREKAQLPKRRKAKNKFSGTVEYMPNPDTAEVTDSKTERGFVYLNLNGGDSWGYYHPEDCPNFIYNFKGEPTYRTEDLLPRYWASLQQQALSYQPNSQGLIYLAFRDFKTAAYFNGMYDSATNELTLAMAKNETQLRHFMAQRGQVMGQFVPDWDIIWEPNNPVVVDAPNQRLNIFKPSELMSSPPAVKHTTVPPLIKRILQHVVADDGDTYTHLLNWLACIVQRRTMTGTAWVWHGTEGTGKGVLYHQIITPLLGIDNVIAKKMKELESEFTGYFENKLFIFIDEVETGKRFYESNIDATLKNLIVEPMISIRKMYMMAYMAPNHTNMAFASNKPEPVHIPPADRRFNVGYYQPKELTLTDDDVNVKIPRELPLFYSFLYHYPADTQQARRPIKNEAKAQLASVGRSSIDTLADALLDGDLAFFWDHLPSHKNQALDGFNSIKLMNYRTLLLELVTKNETKLTRDDLYTLFEWCVGSMPNSPNKFTSLLKHHRIHLTQIWKHSRNVRGITVEWKLDPVWHAAALKEIESKMV